MSDEPRADETRPKSERHNATEPCNPAAPVPGLTDADGDESVRAKLEVSKKLTPDEQMALYEEDLKESDWGHQPC